MWNSILAIKNNLISLRFNLKSSISHYVNNKKIANLDNSSYKKIHFGCGKDYKTDWLNLDVNKVADFWIDVRNPIKLKSGSVEFIYSSHMIEHLEHHEVVFHLKECYRLLEQNGVLRLGVPDFESIIKNYNDNEYLEKYRYVVSGKAFGLPDELICYMDLVNRAFYEFGQHKTAFNYEKIYNLLRFAGFKSDNIKMVDFDEKYDLFERKDATFYVKARK